ncbi:MAG TPA: DUF1499 domain-containing protein [Longimicrobium sp.]|jgi:uncharacterized protein (DUF1499 family)
MTPDDRIPARGPAPPPWYRILAIAALALAVVALLVVASGGPGTRFGWWHFRTGFDLMKWGGRLGLAAAVLAVAAALVARRGALLGIALVALLVGAAAYLVPWNWRRGARQYPPIHDITTDFANPPPLAFSRQLRDSLDINPWQYEGDSIAAQQRKAYPDIGPVLMTLPLDSAYAAAYRTMRDLGWEVTAANRRERTIEAVDVTAWFGFVDDVVVRVSPGSGISRVDIRSVSRVGRGDVGANANRIRKFIAKLKENYPDAVVERG